LQGLEIKNRRTSFERFFVFIRLSWQAGCIFI
jgi:hypothetical protein